MKKKILALLLVAAMAVSTFAGCGNSENVEKETPETTETQEADAEEAVDPDNGEQYDVHIIYRIAPQDETQMQAVEDHINNEILPELIPNTTVSFEFIPASDYIETIKLKSAAGEKMDLMLSMASYGFTDFAAQGAFLSWNEYLEYMPETMALIPESWWDGTSIGGEIYGIPNYQITARSYAVCIDAAMAEKYNVDIDAINSLEDLETMYLEPLAAAGEYANGSISLHAPSIWVNSQAEVFEYANLEQLSNLLVVDKTNPTTVLNLFETSGASEMLTKVREWGEKGYFNFDKIDGLDEKTQMESNLVGTRIDGYQPYWEAQLKTNYNREFLVKQLSDPLVTTASVRSTMTALSYTSENPYRAAKVLDLINSNAELFNAICYGIEGVHYDFNEDGTVAPNTESGYNISNWSYQYGNTMNQYRLAGKAEDYTEKVDALNREANVGVTFGFAYDNSAVSTEWASCSAILDNYKEGFTEGKYEDVQSTLDQMNKELYAAGLQTILDDCQAQMDAWGASK